MKLNVLEPIVLKILEENETARGNDFVLYGCVLKELRIPLTLQLKAFLATADKLKAPIFESVTRVRRRLQARNINLCDLKAREKRLEKIQEYKDYNRGGMEL